MSCRNFPFVWPKVPTLKSSGSECWAAAVPRSRGKKQKRACMHVSPHYLAVCLVDNNWFLWWGWYDAMKNSYFSVQGEILWLAHYDVTIRIYLCCPYFGETVQRGEGLLHTHRTISRLGMGRASNRFIALSKWIFAVKYFMGGSLQSSQQHFDFSSEHIPWLKNLAGW